MSIERVTIAPGLEVSRIWKGGWHLAGGHGDVAEENAIDDMAAFVEAGITTLDTADIYTGVEALIGAFRRRYPELAERIEINHVATDRMVFAQGAVRAAAWLQSQPAGWYGMREVLGLDG